MNTGRPDIQTTSRPLKESSRIDCDIRDDMGTCSHLISCQVGVQKRCFFFQFLLDPTTDPLPQSCHGLASRIIHFWHHGAWGDKNHCCLLPCLPDPATPSEEEGISSLYKGIRPTLLGIMPYVTWLTQFRWSSPLASRMENHIF